MRTENNDSDNEEIYLIFFLLSFFWGQNKGCWMVRALFFSILDHARTKAQMPQENKGCYFNLFQLFIETITICIVTDMVDEYKS